MSVALDTGFCYRHASEATALSCAACERPICTACSQDFPVGQRCPDCAGALRQRVLRPRSVSYVRPVVTYAIAAVIVAVFLGPQHGLAGSGPSVGWGAAWAYGITHGEPWRVLTSAFLHINVLHLALNLCGLLMLGPRLEARFGPVRFALLYLVAAVGGTAGMLLLGEAGAGASGALFGVVGAMYVVERLNRAPIMGGMASYLVMCVVWTVAMHGSAGSALVGGPVSLGGHAGGLAAGLVLGYVIERSPRGRTATGLLDVRSAAGLVAVLAVAVGGVALAAYGGVAFPV